MAALVAGVQYGLSSRNSPENPNEKPVVIFVKFTDSAFRALEEYIKNVDRTAQKPTIQFLQNKGHLSIPTLQGQSSRPQVFNFTLSPNADEGTFECLQSKGSRALESFGAPSHNMCIQAKDDVYETTRHRMAVAEEQQKKNCTKVIKPNLDDIGRKVKVTPWTSGASNHSAKNSSSGGHSDNTRIMHNPPAQNHSRVVSNNHAQKPGNPELMRRPIRERLIHLLALRPYKKPELYDRITRDGLSEKDRKMFSQVLSQVAKLGKDNTYHPVRSVWNDVQEDWPFYTEQDRQILRRRKPQNLTPPGSSDTGSSGSGQSPTSTHPGSPPTVTHVAKRPGYHQSVDGIESKRRRISHYHKRQNDGHRPNSDSTGENYHHEEGRNHQHVDKNSGFGRNRRSEDEQMHTDKNTSDSRKSNNNNNNNNYNNHNISNNNNNSNSNNNLHHHNPNNNHHNNNKHYNSNNNKHHNNNNQHYNSYHHNNYHSSNNNNNHHSNNYHNNNNNHHHNDNNNHYHNDNNNNNNNSHHHNNNNYHHNNNNNAHNNNNSNSNHNNNNNNNNNSNSNHHNNNVSDVNKMPINNYALNDAKDANDENYATEAKKCASDGRPMNDQKFDEKANRSDSPAMVTSSQTQGDAQRSKWGDYSDTRTSYEDTDTIQENTVSASDPTPDYMNEYTTITNESQRRRYKDEFSAHYEEYKSLYSIMERVTQKFTHLETKLKESRVRSHQHYQKMKKHILIEYEKSMADKEYQDAKKKFQYLHEKLSRIKELVLEYDSAYY